MLNDPINEMPVNFVFLELFLSKVLCCFYKCFILKVNFKAKEDSNLFYNLLI